MVTVAVGATFVIVRGATGALPSPVDAASAHKGTLAWARLWREERRTLPRIRSAFTRLAKSVESGCPGALDAAAARPLEEINWPAVSALLDEVEVDIDSAASRPELPAFDRFARRVRRLDWSRRGTRLVVRRSLDDERRYLRRSPRDFCADVRAFAQNDQATPRGTLAFLARDERLGRTAGLGDFQSVLARFGSADDRRLLGRTLRRIIRYFVPLSRPAEAAGKRMIEVVGLRPLQKIVVGDAEAQSNARNMVSEVESCFTEFEDYRKCRHPGNTGLPIGSGPGQVEVTQADVETWTVVGHSPSGTDFTITKDEKERVARSCNRPRVAGCPSSGTW